MTSSISSSAPDSIAFDTTTRTMVQTGSTPLQFSMKDTGIYALARLLVVEQRSAVTLIEFQQARPGATKEQFIQSCKDLAAKLNHFDSLRKAIQFDSVQIVVRSDLHSRIVVVTEQPLQAAA